MIALTLNILPLIDTQVSRFAPVAEVAHKMGTAPQIMYCKGMEIKDPCQMAIESDRLEELNMFMFDTMASSEMALDWWCDRFNVSATDEVIDFVLDAHEAFFGEADQSYLNSVMLDD